MRKEKIMEKVIYLFVDDMRNPINQWVNIPDNIPCLVTRTYFETISFLNQCKKSNIKIMIDLDHDLGEEKTGYDIAKWIVENQYPILSFRIHSMNPVGKMNIKELFTYYGYKEFY